MEELMKDIAELESLQLQATRQKVKNILSVEIHKLQDEITKLHHQADAKDAERLSSIVINSPRRYQVKLNNYAWDQSPKVVKFYVTLPKVQSISPENITCKFTDKSLELEVKDLDNKDHLFVIKNLLNTIKPDESSWKVKSDTILINAVKVIQQKWDFVTEAEKRAAMLKRQLFQIILINPKTPSEGLMTLMKKMYEEGDDEMKRSIAKAFHESQSKKQF